MRGKENLKDKLRKLRGLPPYDGPENIVRGDNYFGHWIRSNWTESEIEQANKELDKERR